MKASKCLYLYLVCITDDCILFKKCYLIDKVKVLVFIVFLISLKVVGISVIKVKYYVHNKVNMSFIYYK